MEEIKDIRKYAHFNSVPIVKDEGAEFICQYILDNDVKTVLEIGTAIGYSAIRFAKLSKDIHVTTIERDIDKVIRAKQNFHDNGLEDRITIFCEDALLATDIAGEFDLIFIDAAKAQYIKFFEKYKQNLSPKGVIISDNLSFHGMVEDLSLTQNYSTIKLVKKIRKYIDFLKENKEFHTDFYKIGDGISISRKITETAFVPYIARKIQNDSDIQIAKKLFYTKGCSLVLCKDEKTECFADGGIELLIKLVESGKNYSSYSVCDRIVGRAAAFLYVLMGIKEVHAKVMGRLAIQILDRAQILYSADQFVDFIKDLKDVELNEVEDAVVRSGSPKVAFQDIKNVLANKKEAAPKA